jgi:hypothetical protein
MTLIHTHADDLRLGDVIVHADGETTVRELDRSAPPAIVVNPGSSDQMSGYLWERVQVRREEQP